MEYKDYSYDGKRIIDILKKASGGKTQTEIADEIGVTQGSISKIKKDFPSVDTLLKISLKYGVSVDELLGLEPQKEKEESPTLKQIMTVIDYLSVHEHISFDHIDRVEMTELNGVNGYPDYDNVSIPIIIPKSKSLRKSIEEYTQLWNCDLDNPTLKRTILTQWVASQFNMNLEDLKEFEDLPFH